MRVGGAKPSRNASAVIASSTAPAALTRWPMLPLMLLTHRSSAAAPNA